MLAFDENGKIVEFRDIYGLEVCQCCHKLYRSSEVEQIPGFREKEDDMCPYCGHINRQSMSYDFYNSELQPEEIAKLERVSLIGTIMAYCDSAYQKSSCVGCSHYNGCPNAGCPENCKICLEEIHFPSRYPLGKRDYDCKRLLDFYVCDYSMKYASEMLYLMRQSAMLKSIDQYNVISLGCGGCPDLMALERYCHEQSFYKKVKYYGIDINPLWKPIHEVIANYRTDTITGIKFDYIDALQMSSILGVNVIVIQYLISRIYNQPNGPKLLDALFDRLITNVILPNSGRPIVILINDVNSNHMGRDCCDHLFHKLTEHNISGRGHKYYFEKENLVEGQRSGTPHASNDNLFDDVLDSMTDRNGFINTYGSWERCSGFQMLLEINP